MERILQHRRPALPVLFRLAMAVLAALAIATLGAGASASPAQATGIPQCEDGLDNDGDGLVDYGSDPGCNDWVDNEEYNAPPPPPPPAAQCSDGADNDGDSKTDYPNDPGCTSTSDNDEYDAPPPVDADGDGTPDYRDNCGKPGTVLGWNDQADYDGDGIGDVCDETPFPDQMVPTWFSTNEEWTPSFSTSSALESINASTGIRCKRQTFTQAFGLGLDFLRYDGTFRVCYMPGVKVTSWSEVHGDASYALPPWDWHQNDSGYPYGIRLNQRAVQFHYRGSIAICVTLLLKGCGPTRHPWVTITFYANNTISRSVGVL
jgi:hypothetical protein